LIRWKYVVDIVAIVVIGAICIKALEHGVNTAMVGVCCSIIAGIAGYVYGVKRSGG